MQDSAVATSARTSDSPGTQVSVLTVTQTPSPTSSKSGAVRAHCQGREALGLDLAIGAIALGGYMIA